MNKITIISENTLEGLEQHRQAWDELIKNCEDVSPVQTYGWVSAFMKYKIKSRYPWVCIFAYRNEEMTGVYPLILTQRTGFYRLQFQFFQLPHDPFHTVRADGLILRGYEHVLEQITFHLKKMYKAIPVIWAQGIPLNSSTNRYFAGKGRKLGNYRKGMPPEDFIQLKGDFQTYTGTLNSKFRREILRQERRLIEKTKVKYRFRDLERSNSRNAEIFAEIENSGWKGLKKTSITGNTGDMELFNDATSDFNTKEWMQWNFLEADDKVIAAQLAVKINSTIYLWKIGYREEFSNMAPGNLLMYRFIEDAFRQGDVDEINFMNERGWLKEWNVSKRDLFNTAIFPAIPLLSFLLKAYYKVKYRRGK